VRSRAIALLGRREYARGELAATLQRKGFEAQTVAEVLSEMVGEGLLNDERYAEALIRQLAARGQGPARIRQALQAAGLASDQVAGALEAGPDWGALAAQTRQRKFGTGIPGSWPERARQMRFLQYKGFSSDQIAGALGPPEAE